MRHKYSTRAIVLARHPLGETSASLVLLTRELGLVRARAQGVRKAGAKLAPALATLAESDVVLVRGAEGWRLSGASLAQGRFAALSRGARERAGRIGALLVRLAPPDSLDERLFALFSRLLDSLVEEPESAHDAAEILAALTLLSALGLDAGELPARAQEVAPKRSSYVARVNRGIEASGL